MAKYHWYTETTQKGVKSHHLAPKTDRVKCVIWFWEPLYKSESIQIWIWRGMWCRFVVLSLNDHRFGGSLDALKSHVVQRAQSEKLLPENFEMEV